MRVAVAVFVSSETGSLMALKNHGEFRHYFWSLFLQSGAHNLFPIRRRLGFIFGPREGLQFDDPGFGTLESRVPPESRPHRHW